LTLKKVLVQNLVEILLAKSIDFEEGILLFPQIQRSLDRFDSTRVREELVGVSGAVRKKQIFHWT
jgi:hypothetical protein